ncbi:MAG TPA: DUF3078 domain-containing protein [Candidatus Marinimicrobia bacterium]|nr:DUF3078 domain-containing protein [Candidatus Neomarinimicrobiota bacterium]HRS51459.1 DUF3078 domain-containing protein [Candidatus Neomarinimicrobiota bacterium]HRU92729.1 DUF3078 domain-containing protein [Candidatus Neomarinimicrobiota bacterium]
MKPKLFLTVVFVLVLFLCATGQVTDVEAQLKAKSADTHQGWKIGGITAVNLAQTSLTNWAAGGQNSLALNGLFSAFANYKKGKNVWDNSLDLGYGVLKQGKDADFMKTDDKVDFLSKYGREAFTNFYYSALFNFKTQMAPGYNYPNDSVKISNFLAPAYLLAAIGMDYKPSNYLSAFIAPATGRLIIVNDELLSNAGAFGVEPGKTTKTEFGGYLRAIYTRNDFKTELLKNLSFTIKIDLFSDYLDHPQNIDINWETLIAFKVNQYISVNFTTHLIYDDDTKISIDKNDDGVIDEFGPRVQFKEILGVGFSYKF